MKKKATFAYWLDPKREKKNGKYPIKLRVTYNRKRQYYGTSIDLSKEEYETMHSINVKGKLKKMLKRLLDIVEEAEKVGNSIPSFSFHQFEDLFFNSPDNSMDVYEAYDRQIELLASEERIGTRDNYKDSKSSLMKFKKRLYFEDVTQNFLNNYEKWMLSNGKSITTVGIYLRPLRALMNQAINDKVILKEQYPFTRKEYKIPTGKKGKIFLVLKEKRLIDDYKALDNSTEMRSRDFWLFSYYANGMNFKDILSLKYKQLENDYFTFKREKTNRTTKDDPIIIDVRINNFMREVIDRWGNQNKNPDNYIFPFINNESSANERKKKLKQFTATTNTHMRNVCRKVGIKKDVTTYVARHTFAYVIITSGGSIEQLREMLGHKSIITTQNYIKSIIPSEKKKELANCLL
ncbi:site-specific integrase [Saccharicrinis aurantiacus]|uniref:site-specific integrase n=1 Tax=Saccharicrinis aurantiacus TaxID=1849719 RepID=UPI0009501CEA|nr:site-specific integrase [Saccharicrinis aurantiacus]